MQEEFAKASHLIVYARWSTIEKWKRYTRSEYSDKSKVELPFAYASDQSRLYRLAGRGTVVWVFSAPVFAGYRLPPSLISRLLVQKVVDLKSSAHLGIQVPKAVKGFGRYVILADRTQSNYFPLNNAYRMLLSLTFVGEKTALNSCSHCKKLQTGKGIYAGIPAHLQTVRQLTPSSGDKIEAFAHAVNSRQIVFLSYRRKEAGTRAIECVETLTAKNFSCWYDQWMIPEPIAEGDIQLEDPLLSAILTDGLRQSTYFVALVTPTYHDLGKWTAKEWESAKDERDNPQRRHPLKLVEILMGGKASGQADIALQGVGGDLGEQLIAAKAFKTMM